MTETRVVLLGTGTPNADPDRMGPSLAVVVDDTPYLVDFGTGIVRRVAAAEQLGIRGMAVSKLDKAFLTHLHSDHTIGYPDLILSPWVLGRKTPLSVWGPAGLKSMTDHLLAAYSADQKVRVCGFEPINVEAFGVNAHEIQPGICYQDELVTVEAFAVKHGDHWLALGYQFTTPDRRVVISGDTRPVDSLIDLWRGCDVLVHEVYSSQGFKRRSAKWQQYHAHMHTSTEELAEIATQVRPKKLVMTHLLLWGSSPADLLAEVTAHYDGEVVCGEDLGVY